MLIIGASVSGVTTLGEALSKKLAIPCFDADFYCSSPLFFA
jgi:shikimate kinase